MADQRKPQVYRTIIDTLVTVCRKGQGQIAARRTRQGVWNPNATADHMPDQHEINGLLARLSRADREILARMLTEQTVVGVFEALKVLEQFQVAPFEDGYEGSAFNDFVGRLADWEWPEH